MEKYTKIKYTPLKYRTDLKSISVPKQANLNTIGIKKYKLIGPQKDLNFNSNTIISLKSNYNSNYLNNNLYHQYNNTEQQVIGKNDFFHNNKIFNNDMNNNVAVNALNKTTPHYYPKKLKDKLLNNLKDNFPADKLKDKKALYVNVNFNVNQNYNIPNYGKKNNRSVSVQNYYVNKNVKNNDSNNNSTSNINVNRSLNTKKIINNNMNNNNYTPSLYEPIKNKSLKKILDKDKQLLKMERKYIFNNQKKDREINLPFRRNPSYTKVLNNKSIDFQKKDLKNTNINSNTNNINKNPQLLINSKNIIFNNNIKSNNYKNILTEPKDNLKNKNNNKELQINYILNNLELEMQRLLSENKTESKGKIYNTIRKIFDKAINVMSLSQIEKNFLKLILIKYHDVVYAFSQENKALKQSGEHLQNLNFTLDKKYLELEKQYKIILKENQEIKRFLSSQKANEKKPANDYEKSNKIHIKINNNDKNKNKNITKENINSISNINNNSGMIKIIKDINFVSSGKNKNEEKNEDKGNKNDNIINIKEIIEINKNDNKENNNKIKEEKNCNEQKNIKNNKFEQFNKINVSDLDSLYFYDKVNNTQCYNSQKNYDKVPKINLKKI